MTKYIPISKARAKISELADQVRDQGSIYLTRNGEVSAVLVDPEYLNNLEKEVEKLFSKTYIDKKLLPLTRSFTKKEIDEWLEEDKL